MMRPLPGSATQPLPPDGPTVDAPEDETIPVPEDDTFVEEPTEELRLSYYAVSDVGRVRKDNQDSGYAGPWLLAVCDGVGGAARGDIASSTAVNELRQLDEAPGSADLLTRVADGLHEAHESIAAQVYQDAALSGTSTTATVALFDGHRIAIGHIGDSRGYLLRGGELSQITSDHTFVQSLIDEGRITEEEARVHPHRNLILKALDGLHEVEPDLFAIALAPGDRVFLCSDGACGVLEDARMADILVQRVAGVRRDRAGPRQPRRRQLRQRHLRRRRRAHRGERGRRPGVRRPRADGRRRRRRAEAARAARPVPRPPVRRHRRARAGRRRDPGGRRLRRSSTTRRSIPRPIATRRSPPAASPGCAG